MTSVPQILTYSRGASLSSRIAAGSPFVLVAAVMLYLAYVSIQVDETSSATFVLIAAALCIFFVVAGVIWSVSRPALAVTRDEMRVRGTFRTRHIPINAKTLFGTFASDTIIGRRGTGSTSANSRGRRVQTIALWVRGNDGAPIHALTVHSDLGRIIQFMNQVTELTGHEVEALKRDMSRPLVKVPDLSHWT